MRVTADIPSRPAALELALEGWIARSRMQLRDHPTLPRLYQSGVRYKTDPAEVWRTTQETLKLGEGDCGNLVIARVAELRERDGEIGARPFVYETKTDGLFHAVVQRADGSIEDPSIKLGMKPSGARRRERTHHMAGEDEATSPARARVLTTTTSDGAAATIQWRGAMYQITVQAKGANKVEATARAAEVSKEVYEALRTRSTAIPALKALLPPQAALAIRAASGLTKLARKGWLGKAIGKLKGPALSLAKNLVEE